jgi:hypothetical protein
VDTLARVSSPPRRGVPPFHINAGSESLTRLDICRAPVVNFDA